MNPTNKYTFEIIANPGDKSLTPVDLRTFADDEDRLLELRDWADAQGDDYMEMAINEILNGTYAAWTEADVQRLKDAGQKWAAARQGERDQSKAAYLAIMHAYDKGMPETRIANLVGVDRMTVRRALDKL